MSAMKSNNEWEIQEDVRTIIRANEILNDPKRKKRALVEVEKQKKATEQAAQQLETKTQQRIAKLRSK
jgi:hypothetical protein